MTAALSDASADYCRPGAPAAHPTAYYHARRH